MHSLALCLLLSFGTAPVDSVSNALWPDGTLLFLENCNSVVEYSTRGKIGHVALAFRDEQEMWIYEATPAKVRRVSADDYFAELARLNQRRDADDQMRLWVLQPKTPYSGVETAKMRAFLDAQVGRRYSLRNYVRGKSDGPHSTKLGPVEVEVVLDTGETKPTDGIHCAELASSTLTESGRYAFRDFHKIHPQALYSAVLATHEPPVEKLVPAPATRETWCVRAQRRWTEAWTWCGWSCGEAWAFCW
jgi:hypothetical protein